MHDAGGPLPVSAMLDVAIQQYQAGERSAAEVTGRAILAQVPHSGGALHLLAVIACDRGDPGGALHLLDRAAGEIGAQAFFHNTRARALLGLGLTDKAEAVYRLAWPLRPGDAAIANNLACLLRECGDLAGAVTWFRTANGLQPTSADIACNLADAVAAQGNYPEALEHFRRALALCPDCPDIHGKCGAMFLAWGRAEEAEQMCRTAVRLRPGNAAGLNNLGLALQAQGRTEAALQSFADAIRADPGCADAHYNLGCLLLLENRQDEARSCHDRALAAAPLHGPALWARCMVELPVLYDTQDQVGVQRARYTHELGRLESLAADNPAGAKALADAAGASQPFFLPYQGHCDRDLQARYGTLMARVLDQAAPPLAAPPSRGERIRIGIVSGFFCEHTVWRLMLKGWLGHLDRDRFDVTAYHTAAAEDAQTRVAQRLCPRFVTGPATALRQAILQQRPHVLLYPEIGMDRVAARLAGERLAPIQCVAWGQPETTGLPTMDIFLSSELMEPEGAGAHYTERLVPLPNLGIHYEPDERAAEPCTRAELGVRDGAVLFWCGQALYKYLPQHDEIFARIAASTGDCQFLFIGFARSQPVTEQFRSRLHRAFASHGLDADRHVLIAAPMSQERFLGSVRLADVVLDSIGWSGGKSTLDMLAEAPVIITHAGPMLRGRHTAGILTGIGVAETIAATLDDFVDLAVRFGRHPGERAAVRRRVAANRHRIVADLAPIRAMEAALDGLASVPT